MAATRNKIKPNKGLLKRIRVTKSGKIKLGRAGGRHLRSHKSGKLRRNYRKPKYAVASETRRLSRMLLLPLRSAEEAAAAEQAEANRD